MKEVAMEDFTARLPDFDIEAIPDWLDIIIER